MGWIEFKTNSVFLKINQKISSISEDKQTQMINPFVNGLIGWRGLKIFFSV